jgi:hypothetical protein
MAHIALTTDVLAKRFGVKSRDRFGRRGIF